MYDCILMGNTARDQNSFKCSNYHLSGNAAPSASSSHRRSGILAQYAEGGELKRGGRGQVSQTGERNTRARRNLEHQTLAPM